MSLAAGGGYLVIGGSTKCATTSLYAYLKTHPEVRAARMKETRFFLSPDYPVPVKRSYAPGATYESLFDDPGNRLRLEATPDYLYSEGTAQRLFAALPGVRLLFVLRHPVARLLSWYRYAREAGMLARDVTLEAYVRAQLEGSAPCEQHYLALEQGRYSRYLNVYLECLGRERVLVLRYEDLVAQPAGAMERVCSFAGIDPLHFHAFDYRVHNPTSDPRFPALVRSYRQVRGWVHQHLTAMPRTRTALRAVRRTATSLLAPAVRAGEAAPPLPGEIREQLAAYYADEGKRVAWLTGEGEPSWWPDLDSAADGASGDGTDPVLRRVSVQA